LYLIKTVTRTVSMHDTLDERQSQAALITDTSNSNSSNNAKFNSSGSNRNSGGYSNVNNNITKNNKNRRYGNDITIYKLKEEKVEKTFMFFLFNDILVQCGPVNQDSGNEFISHNGNHTNFVSHSL